MVSDEETDADNEPDKDNISEYEEIEEELVQCPGQKKSIW